jgi:predicted dehydrogenase
LRHFGGALSTLSASLRAVGPGGATLYGTRATLHIRGPIWRPTDAVLIPTAVAGNSVKGPRRLEGFRESRTGLHLSNLLNRLKAGAGRGKTRLRPPFAGNGYHYQVQAVMQAVRAGHREDPRMPLAQSVEVMTLIDAARAQWSAGGSA